MRYLLIASENSNGERVAWQLFQKEKGEDWDEIGAIGTATTADALDWAEREIDTAAQGVNWKSADGTVFSGRWSAQLK